MEIKQAITPLAEAGAGPGQTVEETSIEQSYARIRPVQRRLTGESALVDMAYGEPFTLTFFTYHEEVSLSPNPPMDGARTAEGG